MKEMINCKHSECDKSIFQEQTTHNSFITDNLYSWRQNWDKKNPTFTAGYGTVQKGEGWPRKTEKRHTCMPKGNGKRHDKDECQPRKTEDRHKCHQI